MHHTEADFAGPVADFVVAHGVAYFDDIYAHIEQTFNLNEDDQVIIPSNRRPRYKQILTNLRSNRTLESMGRRNIVPIDRGFATASFAAANELRVVELGDAPVRNPERAAPRLPKLTPQQALAQAYINLRKPSFSDQKAAADDVRIRLLRAQLSSNGEMVQLAENVLRSHM